MSHHGHSRARCKCGRMAHLDERTQAAYAEAARRIAGAPAPPAETHREGASPPDHEAASVQAPASADDAPTPPAGAAGGAVRDWSPAEVSAPAELPPEQPAPAEPEPMETAAPPAPPSPPARRRPHDFLDLLGGRRREP